MGVAAYFDDHHMIIVGDHPSWAIETDTARIELAPRPTFPFATAAVPRQRHPDQREGEE
jgi:hypothetical protein